MIYIQELIRQCQIGKLPQLNTYLNFKFGLFQASLLAKQKVKVKFKYSIFVVKIFGYIEDSRKIFVLKEKKRKKNRKIL